MFLGNFYLDFYDYTHRRAYAVVVTWVWRSIICRPLLICSIPSCLWQKIHLFTLRLQYYNIIHITILLFTY
jgi:hypothetical protein